MGRKMAVGVLFSGGKDSTLALYYTKRFCDVKVLITIISENKNSYMFHTPNISLVEFQGKAIGLPVLIKRTKGEKEAELIDLEKAVLEARKKYKIGGIVSGALASAYQASRIQRICNKLHLECFNPLWQKDQFELLEEIVRLRFNAIITGVFAAGMENLLGKHIDRSVIRELRKIHKKYKINPAGEGGEFESFVLDAIFFKKRLEIASYHIEGEGEERLLVIEKVRMCKK